MTDLTSELVYANLKIKYNIQEESVMNLILMKILLALGILGHALNMYCDRILSIFPNGTLKLEDMNTIGEEGKMAKVMEGVSAKVPMRSAILGAFALFFQFLGYFSITAYLYSHSHIFGSVAFAAITFFITIGTAHHVKFALAEYVFVKLGRDEKAKSLMLDLYTSSPVTRLCYIGYLIFIVTLIVSIVTGVAAFPVWAVIFTILPVFLLLFPFRIIGTLHISAMVSMAAWIFLI